MAEQQVEDTDLDGTKTEYANIIGDPALPAFGPGQMMSQDMSAQLLPQGFAVAGLPVGYGGSVGVGYSMGSGVLAPVGYPAGAATLVSPGYAWGTPTASMLGG
eukprot:895969_1